MIIDFELSLKCCEEIKVKDTAETGTANVYFCSSCGSKVAVLFSLIDLELSVSVLRDKDKGLDDLRCSILKER